MKKLLCVMLAVLLVVSLSGCVDSFFAKNIMGTWSYRVQESQENVDMLLENLDMYPEEIALIETPLYTVKHLEFNEDMTYRYYYEVETEKTCVREFLTAAFESIYAGRDTLAACYEMDMSAMTKDEFFQFYAQIYSQESFEALIDTFVELAYDYESLSNTESGTYTVSLNQITMDAPGEEYDGTVGYKLEDDTLTLTYSDSTEVYTKVN